MLHLLLQLSELITVDEFESAALNVVPVYV